MNGVAMLILKQNSVSAHTIRLFVKAGTFLVTNTFKDDEIACLVR